MKRAFRQTSFYGGPVMEGARALRNQRGRGIRPGAGTERRAAGGEAKFAEWRARAAFGEVFAEGGASQEGAGWREGGKLQA